MSPKPRCATCPHYCDENAIDDYGVCELEPARYIGPPARENDGSHPWAWAQPIMSALETCSHHPDLPAWLAEWKARRVESTRGDGQGMGKAPPEIP